MVVFAVPLLSTGRESCPKQFLQELDTGCWEEDSSAQQVQCTAGSVLRVPGRLQVNPGAGHCTASSVKDSACDGAWQLDCMQVAGVPTTSKDL